LEIARAQAAHLIPHTIDLGAWPQIAPLFDQLEARAAECQSAADLERWLLDWSELSAALDEESSRRYIAMTCHTDNAEAEKAYLHFVENVEPQLKPRQFEIEKIYVAHPQRAELLAIEAPASGTAQSTDNEPCRRPAFQRYEVFDRDVKNHVELFRPKNVTLETEDAKLCQQYQKLTGSLTVNFRGDEKTLVQMGRYLEEPDRALRQEAWELVARRRLQEVDNFDEIFDRLIELRQQPPGTPGSKITVITPFAGSVGSITHRKIARVFTMRSPGKSCPPCANSTPPAAGSLASTNCIRAICVRGIWRLTRRIVRR